MTKKHLLIFLKYVSGIGFSQCLRIHAGQLYAIFGGALYRYEAGLPSGFALVSVAVMGSAFGMRAWIEGAPVKSIPPIHAVAMLQTAR